MNHIALERIPHRRIRSFIKVQLKNNVNSVRQLEASFQHGDCTEHLRYHHESFVANHPIERVWEFYQHTGPNQVFRDKLVSFGLMLSKSDENQVIYKEEPCAVAEVGQVYFMNLKIWKGIVQIAVSYEIIEINENERFFEFSYIKGGKSIGLQRISLTPMQDGSTKISHVTHYKSDSALRDKFFYPYFHTKVLQEYHLNMIEFMNQRLSA